jgi:predicted CXXCH cytochrome family protein
MIALLFLLAMEDCTPCHSAIVGAYQKTPMAQTSGAVGELKEGRFQHAPSKTTYRMSGKTVSVQTPQQKAVQTLHYSIGSGAHGSSYLFLRGSQLFQAPVTYFRQKGWAMSPGYENDDHSDWTRPVDRNCLWCHASGTRLIYGTINQYAQPPFRESGITCERCHSKSGAHYNNPAKLASEPRNDVCRQCHMTGLARSDKPGHTFFEFKPGMRLNDLVTYSSAQQRLEDDLKVTGHFERLAMSKCQIASGDKLWCGSCHNPHPVQAVDANASCRSCHAAATCQRGPDCHSCHMPKAPSREAGHSVFTDHWIRKKR